MMNEPNLPSNLLDQGAVTQPESVLYNPLKDKVYVTGLILLAISVLTFSMFQWGERRWSDPSYFIINFTLVWIYTIVLWASRRLRWWMFGARREHYPSMLLLLMLWLVSCFGFNREVRFFAPSEDWLIGYLCISGAACIAYAWKDVMSTSARHALWFVMGASVVIFAYFAISLFPLALIGTLFFWFFGLTLHAWAPLALMVYLILILRNAIRDDPFGKRYVFTGVAMPVAICLVFSVAWFRFAHQVKTAVAEYRAAPGDMPEWVYVSQRLNVGVLDKILLKALAEDKVGAYQNGLDDPWIFGGSHIKNDPLMQVAALSSSKPLSGPWDYKRIYATLYDRRRSLESPLWSDNDLITTRVESRVLLDPEHRLSYTEKLLTVSQRTFGNSNRTFTQEALYTFYLPEGGAVTALSLWINGKEEPGILTAKSKAGKAYNTIVGVERRDPAIVYWQEGNQVLVRVFPVTPDAPRQFKVGITAPMRYEDEMLQYTNVSFDGPPATSASELDSVYFESNGKFTEITAEFDSGNGGKTLLFEGGYRHNWSVRCEAPPLRSDVFTFDGKSYTVSAWNNPSEPFLPRNIYLDLNEAWTQPELSKMRALIGRYTVFVPSDTVMEPLTEDNYARIFQKTRSLRYTLFPFHLVEDPANSLIITKSAAPSPLPSELVNSRFYKKINQWKTFGVRVFQLGEKEEMTTYLRAFSDERKIYCVSGTMNLLDKHLIAGTFPKNPENENTVAIPSSDVLITRRDSVGPGKAPDHLFRLFAYNTIMKEWPKDTAAEPERLLRLAEQAYVVSPVSSLVTLETQQDYEKFDIQPTPGLFSLGNAGSVPEPHEWALMVLLTVAVFFAWRYKN